jgi:hypothetical protein
VKLFLTKHPDGRNFLGSPGPPGPGRPLRWIMILLGGKFQVLSRSLRAD